MGGNHRRRAFRTRLEHQLVIVQAFEEEPALLHVNPTDRQSKSAHNAKWKILTEKLNDLGFGEKTTDKWQRAVTDWVSKIKTKYIKIRDFLHASGYQRPAGGLNLSDLEVRILSLKGYDCQLLEGLDVYSKFPEPQKKKTAKNDVVLPKSDTSLSVEEVINVPNPIIIKEESVYQDVDSNENIDNESIHEEYYYEIERPAKTMKLAEEPIYINNEGSEGCSVQEETLRTLKCINENISRLTNAVEQLVQSFQNK